MDFFDFLAMVGGLALFLFGMNMLGDGLAKMSGGKFEQILEKLTNNPIKAVLLGAGVTAIIQSSSATTVMVVGFVNSGIMKLQQAVGIIMGANIGTTVTSWILGLAGIEDGSFFQQLLKPTSFSPILAIIGVAIIMFSKKDKLKNVAAIMVGFAILMFGMDAMSEAVKPLRDVPEFTSILTKFSHPILGMLAGLILTAVIQSSSASVGILQALCVTGAVGFNTAIPIIMGQNIGTCVTALISAMGASKNAKRAALVHFYFNLIGTTIFMIGFYTINAIYPLPFMEQAATPWHIAIIHSVFNVVATLILLPFSKGLVKLACLTIKDETTDETVATNSALQLLEPRFLEMPAYAIEQSKAVAEVMAGMAEEAVNLAVGLFGNYTEETAKRVVDLECEVDKFEDEIGNYLVRLSALDMAEKDSYMMSTVLHCIGDFERISDHARNLKEAAEEMHVKGMEFSDKAKAELEVFTRAIHDILKITVLSFSEEDITLAGQVEPLEEVIDGLNLEIKKRHVKRLKKGKCTIELGFVLSDITTNLERISDHCSNVAVYMLQQITGEEIEAHEYLDGLKTDDNIDFRGKVMTFRERYQLPS